MAQDFDIPLPLQTLNTQILSLFTGSPTAPPYTAPQVPPQSALSGLMIPKLRANLVGVVGEPMLSRSLRDISGTIVSPNSKPYALKPEP